MHDLITTFASVALGGFLGGPTRFLVSGIIARRWGETFPFGTLTVNVVGAFLIGAAAAFALALPATLPWALAVTGFLGSFTTVSSLALQTLVLAQDGEIGRAFANVAVSLALGLLAVTAGFAATAALLPASAS